MSDIIFVIKTTLTILIVVEAIDSYFLYKKRRFYEKEAVRERCRREFGILRTSFFELTKNDKIDINSCSSQFIFLHLTKLVRNPDHFKEYIEAYIQVLGKKNEDPVAAKMVTEIREWPSEAHAIINNTGRTIDKELLLVFSPLSFRTLVAIFGFLHNFAFSRRLLENLFERQREETSVKKYNEVNNNVCHESCYSN